MSADSSLPPVAGASVYAELQQAVVRAKDDAQQRLAELNAQAETIDALAQRKSEAVLRLAKHYLPQMRRDLIEQTFDQVRLDLLAILNRKEHQAAELERRRQSSQADVQQAEAELARLQIAYEAAAQELQQRETELQHRLQADQGFQERSRQAVQLEAELRLNESRLEEVQLEAAEKLPAYQASSLFQYLADRDYAGPDYSHRGLTRRLDGWLARLIDYRRVRPSYQFLRATPELMAHEIDRRREELESLLRELEQMEATLAAELKLEPARREEAQLQADLLRAKDKLDAATRQVEQTHQELAELQRSEGRFHQEAIARLQRFLEETQTEVLQAHAEQTAERADDLLVAEVRLAADEIAAARRREEKLSQNWSRAEQHVSNLEWLIRRFRQLEYQTERSRFAEGFELPGRLEALRRGSLDKEALWEGIRGQQQFLPDWAQQTAEQVSDVINSPAAKSLATAMVKVAGTPAIWAIERHHRRRMRNR